MVRSASLRKRCGSGVIPARILLQPAVALSAQPAGRHFSACRSQSSVDSEVRPGRSNSGSPMRHHVCSHCLRCRHETSCRGVRVRRVDHESRRCLADDFRSRRSRIGATTGPLAGGNPRLRTLPSLQRTGRSAAQSCSQYSFRRRSTRPPPFRRAEIIPHLAADRDTGLVRWLSCWLPSRSSMTLIGSTRRPTQLYVNEMDEFAPSAR